VARIKSDTAAEKRRKEATSLEKKKRETRCPTVPIVISGNCKEKNYFEFGQGEKESSFLKNTIPGPCKRGIRPHFPRAEIHRARAGGGGLLN